MADDAKIIDEAVEKFRAPYGITACKSQKD